MSVIFACIALCVVTICAYPWWYYRRARKLFAHLPCLFSLPLIGNLHLFLGDGELPPISDPQDLKKITTTFMEKPSPYNKYGKVFYNGLVSAPGHIWKHTSRKLSPAFSGSVIAGYQATMNDQSQKLVELLKNHHGKEPFEVLRKYINPMYLEGIYYTTFGEPTTAECAVTMEFHYAVDRILKLACKRAILLPLYFDFIYNLTNDWKKEKQAIEIIHNFLRNMIDKRKQARAQVHKEHNDENNSDENSNVGFKPYIDTLLELGETDPVFTQQQIMSELGTIIEAGHETISITLTNCLLMLGSHSHAQDKLYAEMKSLFGDSNRPVTKEDLAQMPYCEAVVNETLRMFPTIPLTFRSADRDLDLSQCTVPKGTIVTINYWGVGRSKHLWGLDAETFRPDRWMEFPDGQAPFFIPFSYGKRVCIGKRYSMAMLKTTLAYISRELIIKSDIKNMRLRLYVTLQPFKGNYIQVFKRE